MYFPSIKSGATASASPYRNPGSNNEQLAANNCVLPVACRLHFKHFRVETARAHQLFVISFFDQASTGEDHNSVRHADGGETVRDEKRHLAQRQFGKTFKDLQLTACI